MHRRALSLAVPAEASSLCRPLVTSTGVLLACRCMMPSPSHLSRPCDASSGLLLLSTPAVHSAAGPNMVYVTSELDWCILRIQEGYAAVGIVNGISQLLLHLHGTALRCVSTSGSCKRPAPLLHVLVRSTSASLDCMNSGLHCIVQVH